MRAALRLFTPRSPAFTPTGVTGVLTHPHPRPTLLAVYNETLKVLSQLPSHSVYRKSAENLTKHRLAIVEAAKPPGFDEYASHYGDKPVPIEDVGLWMKEALWHFLKNTPDAGHKLWIEHQIRRWDPIPMPEGLEQKVPKAEATKPEDLEYNVVLEPDMTAEQVTDVENKIQDGLIEDIIESGWNELVCAKTMLKEKVWEPLEVAPEKGQWEAFERTPKAVTAQD
ncbi:hypothetical protein EX30DRAFT_339489 [Ascodesmis nigricans]|uniref:Uncharacterized protein n=1 Tax=Ascodesmis nigricans TaxID=341454 RepID=A0A4S2N2G2_9PEZI|nr:hypothetical protein EX30DRAFT_339489 [Ascodesmis nigricans]